MIKGNSSYYDSNCGGYSHEDTGIGASDLWIKAGKPALSWLTGLFLMLAAILFVLAYRLSPRPATMRLLVIIVGTYPK